MGRKNYSTKDRRRKHVVEYAPQEVQADFSVTLTNGSGFKNITVAGTPVSCWNWCIRAGLEPGGNLEGYYPIAIKKVGDTDAIFTVI